MGGYFEQQKAKLDFSTKSRKMHAKQAERLIVAMSCISLAKKGWEIFVAYMYLLSSSSIFQYKHIIIQATSDRLRAKR